MNFEFIPVAEASVVTLMKSINKVIINPLILFLFALALVYFLYGVAQYILNSNNEEVRKKSRSHMLYGVIGLFIMVAVFGIMNLILRTVGERRIKIQNTGDYEILNKDNTSDNVFDSAGNELNPLERNILSGNDVDLRSAENIDLTNVPTVRPSNFDISPFLVKYKNSTLCWRQEVHVSANTEYKALQSVKSMATKIYTEAKGPVIPSNMPINFGILTAYDPVTKTYHAWMDARAPMNGGNANDCILQIDKEKTGELPLDDYVKKNPSSTVIQITKGPNPLTKVYTSDDLFYRVVASGVDPILEVARELALMAAFKAIGVEIKDINYMTTVYGKVLEERYTLNQQTGNYEYWVAVESSRSGGGTGGR
jgi:hypothetical protein